MIDHRVRRKYSELARQLVSARITNYQFEDNMLASKDWALNEVHESGLWCAYDDLHEHKLNGKWSLNPQQKKIVARIILFLQSGAPYRWPRRTGWPAIARFSSSLATLGLYRCFAQRNDQKALWPFFTQAEYEAALAQPVFLNGKSRPTSGSTRRPVKPAAR